MEQRSKCQEAIRPAGTQVLAGNGGKRGHQGDRGLQEDRNPSALSCVPGTGWLYFIFHKCTVNFGKMELICSNSLLHSIFKVFVVCQKFQQL